MDHSRKGALAAAASLDGSRLKLLVVGEGGALSDVNGRLCKPSPRESRLPNYLGLADGPRVLGSLWTDGGLVDVAHPKSAVAVCTIERLNLICVFYQVSDGSIVMRRCHMGAEWKWESDVKTIIAPDYETAPYVGTSLVVQPNILRVGDSSDLKLFYQNQEGHLAVQRTTESGELGIPAFITQLAIPEGTPFTALSNNDEFTISYITLRTKEVWECSGTLSLEPLKDYDEDETYMSVAQRFELKDPLDVVQMAAFQAEQPIVISMTGSPISRVVWSSSQNRRKYVMEVRGLPGTGIALVGHANLRSSVTYFFIDTNGAVNVGRLASGSADGKQVPEHYPIPLGSMHSAFGWTIPGWTGYPEVRQPLRQETRTRSVQQMSGSRTSAVVTQTRYFSDRSIRSQASLGSQVTSIYQPPISDVTESVGYEAEIKQVTDVPFEEINEPIEEPVEEPFEEVIEEAIGEPTEEPVEESIEQTVEEAIEEAVEEPLSQPELPEPIAPSCPLADPASTPAYTSLEATTYQSFFEIFYERLESVFKPAGNQYLSLQLPARDLTQLGFNRETSGAIGHLEEPAAMKEAYFQLADELFDVGRSVSQPNGKSMSAVYEQILDNVVPKLEEGPQHAKLEEMREWLTTMVSVEVHDQVPPSVTSVPSVGQDFGSLRISVTKPHGLPTLSQTQFPSPSSPCPAQILPSPAQAYPGATLVNGGFESESHIPKGTSGGSASTTYAMTRMQFAQFLFDVYMQARSAWETERDGMTLEAAQTVDAAQRDKITRRLADITREREAKLAALYSDAVVRGNLRTVREYLGYLDVKSPSELLLFARDCLRESARSSPQSLKVTYPIRMLPADWLKSSTTSYAAEEFFYDVRALQTQITQESLALDNLCDRLLALRLPNEEHIKALEVHVDDLTKSQDEIQAKLLSQYPTANLPLAKLNTASFLRSGESSFASLTPTSPALQVTSQSTSVTVPDDHSISFGEEVRAWQEPREKVATAARTLARELARIECSNRGEMQAKKSQLQQQVVESYSKIEHLTSRMAIAQVGAARREEGAARSISEVHLSPSEDSRWTTISFSTKVPNKTWKHVSGTSEDIALWLGSVIGGSPSPNGADCDANVEDDVTVEVNLRVSRVTVDRSSWFQPQFMEKSSKLMRKSEHRPWSHWPVGINTPEEAVKSIKDGQFDSDASLMPAFADAYIIAKDILVKVPTPGRADPTHIVSQSAAAADGILCFGFSHTSQSSSNLSRLHIQEMSDGTVFRIAGPQIVGYVMQLTPVDSSSPYDQSKGVGVVSENSVCGNSTV